MNRHLGFRPIVDITRDRRAITLSFEGSSSRPLIIEDCGQAIHVVNSVVNAGLVPESRRGELFERIERAARDIGLPGLQSNAYLAIPVSIYVLGPATTTPVN